MLKFEPEIVKYIRDQTKGPNRDDNINRLYQTKDINGYLDKENLLKALFVHTTLDDFDSQFFISACGSDDKSIKTLGYLGLSSFDVRQTQIMMINTLLKDLDLVNGIYARKLCLTYMANTDIVHKYTSLDLVKHICAKNTNQAFYSHLLVVYYKSYPLDEYLQVCSRDDRYLIIKLQIIIDAVESGITQLRRFKLSYNDILFLKRKFTLSNDKFLMLKILQVLQRLEFLQVNSYSISKSDIKVIGDKAANSRVNGQALGTVGKFDFNIPEIFDEKFINDVDNHIFCRKNGENCLALSLQCAEFLISLKIYTNNVYSLLYKILESSNASAHVIVFRLVRQYGILKEAVFHKLLHGGILSHSHLNFFTKTLITRKNLDVVVENLDVIINELLKKSKSDVNRLSEHINSTNISLRADATFKIDNCPEKSHIRSDSISFKAKNNSVVSKSTNANPQYSKVFTKHKNVFQNSRYDAIENELDRIEKSISEATEALKLEKKFNHLIIGSSTVKESDFGCDSFAKIAPKDFDQPEYVQIDNKKDSFTGNVVYSHTNFEDAHNLSNNVAEEESYKAYGYKSNEFHNKKTIDPNSDVYQTDHFNLADAELTPCHIQISKNSNTRHSHDVYPDITSSNQNSDLNTDLDTSQSPNVGFRNLENSEHYPNLQHLFHDMGSDRSKTFTPKRAVREIIKTIIRFGNPVINKHMFLKYPFFCPNIHTSKILPRSKQIELFNDIYKSTEFDKIMLFYRTYDSFVTSCDIYPKLKEHINLCLGSSSLNKKQKRLLVSSLFSLLINNGEIKRNFAFLYQELRKLALTPTLKKFVKDHLRTMRSLFDHCIAKIQGTLLFYQASYDPQRYKKTMKIVYFDQPQLKLDDSPDFYLRNENNGEEKHFELDLCDFEAKSITIAGYIKDKRFEKELKLTKMVLIPAEQTKKCGTKKL